MIRESFISSKLLIFEGTIAFLHNEDPKRVRLNVIKNVSGTIEFGSKIELERGDLIIITVMLKNEILISVSEYRGFGKFEEQFFEFAEVHNSNIGEGLSEKNLRIVKKNIAALKATA